MGVQFAPLVGYSTALAGAFWKQVLSDEWRRVEEAPRLDDQFERFGSEQIFAQTGFIGVQIRSFSALESNRLQIIRSDEQRMIQLQSTRFIYNWRKQPDSDYPSYDEIVPEFHRSFAQFQDFAVDQSLQKPELNQWELTYVNHIPANSLWHSTSDWKRVFPEFYLPPRLDVTPLGCESVSADWRIIIGDNKGRLHISLRHGRRTTDSPEFIALQFTARGPIDAESGSSLEEGLNLGHDTIVRTFEAMTSLEAQHYWRKRT